MSDDIEDQAETDGANSADPGAATQEANDQMAAPEDNNQADPNAAAQSVNLKDLSERPENGNGDEDNIERSGGDLEAVFDIPVNVSAVLGKSRLQVSQLLKLGRGAIVELDRKVGEAIDIYVNDRLVARGEVVLVDDRLGVTMTEIVKGEG